MEERRVGIVASGDIFAVHWRKCAELTIGNPVTFGIVDSNGGFLSKGMAEEVASERVYAEICLRLESLEIEFVASERFRRDD